MEESLSYMNNRFNNRLNELIEEKGENNQIFTKSAYLSMIRKVKESKMKVTSKLPEEYQRLRRYDVVSIGNLEKLIMPVKEDNAIKYYVHTEEIFQILHDAHIAIGHGGRNRMEKELSTKYKNITREMIIIYLNLCEICQKKKNVPKKGLVVKPILCNKMNSRCQVDLTDMQSQADEEYKFILVYQDHLTKFVQLRPLKTKRAEEVAHVLLDIFTIFGAPSILQSDNGREFANNIIKEMCNMWSELKMVHGKPRHSQSQGSVERCNQDVENMLSSWLETNNTNKWSEGLRFVQLMKNRAYHTGINCSPYEAMFGAKLKVGLKNFIPNEYLINVNTEEDLERLYKTIDEVSQSCSNSESPGTVQENIMKDYLIMPPLHSNITDEVQRSTSPLREKNLNQDVISITELVNEEEETIETVDPKIEEKKRSVSKTREMALFNLKKQAEKMINTSNSKYTAANVGDTVRIRVPDVDRARSDGKNILGVVVAVKDKNL
ncbi:KRAB-A domain-containing protein 2-like, partial [Centruroides sculpturatus]|uniref:KRAB-A domain-containing protein 2-like n=1 Tax=Centruroides sculpturatus TaxID=218467 RepID=UPI000C6D48BD